MTPMRQFWVGRCWASTSASASSAAGKSSSAGVTKKGKVSPDGSPAYSTCLHMVDGVSPSMASTEEWANARPYEQVPGPRPLPFFGNTWRLFPYVGQYKISDIARISYTLHRDYGRIVRFSGLVGRPDLLFVYDADEIEKCYRHEGPTPFRPSMPCLVKYKSVVRKDFFGDLPGVVGV